MNPNHRNLKVVLALIASMTLGAAALLALEPPGRGWSRNVMLQAQPGSDIQQLEIWHVANPLAYNLVEFDGVIFPDGRVTWRPRGAHVRLAVVAPESLSESQALRLLAVLGGAIQGLGLPLDRIALRTVTDDAGRPMATPAERQIRQLLERKGIPL